MKREPRDSPPSSPVTEKKLLYQYRHAPDPRKLGENSPRFYRVRPEAPKPKGTEQTVSGDSDDSDEIPVWCIKKYSETSAPERITSEALGSTRTNGASVAESKSANWKKVRPVFDQSRKGIYKVSNDIKDSSAARGLSRIAKDSKGNTTKLLRKVAKHASSPQLLEEDYL